MNPTECHSEIAHQKGNEQFVLDSHFSNVLFINIYEKKNMRYFRFLIMNPFFC